MRVVYHAESLIDAHLVKDALDHVGVPCFINGEYLAGGIGQLPARDFLTVSVPDVCVGDAGPVVREIEAMLQTPVAEDPAQPAAEHGDDATPPLRLRPAPI